ncbi:uncharacterized protein LOC131618949 [Vicia villosa]|uniref:uncharacterized protein LOC131618949 n=1 Tax=Vicia villosa TaxID=3911 RepID=UPI00273CCAF3|nr:uncharacterized protein LOC131618949 [Vicia villosa]
MRKSIEIGEFRGFGISGSCVVDTLQFANDMLLVGEGSWKHVWAIKAVLRAFELVLGLGINYHNSKLIGINVNNNFLNVASYVLSSKVKDCNFYFLGIPIGCNPRNSLSWLPLLSKTKKCLSGWKNHFLSMRGRITLLKSILSSLTISTMNFYKMSVKVLN